MSKAKPNAAKPSAGANPAVGKKAAIPSQGARKAAGKDSANVRDAYREGNRPAEWSRKSKKNHADEKARREQGGS